MKIFVPKDTKSLGNNKAPACESRGFVRKKKKVCFLTHLHLFYGILEWEKRIDGDGILCLKNWGGKFEVI